MNEMTITLRVDQVRLIKDILLEEYLYAKKEGEDMAEHAEAVDEVLISLNEQFTE